MAEPLLTDDQCALIRCLSKTHLTLLVVGIESFGWAHAQDLLTEFYGRPGSCRWVGRKLLGGVIS